MMPAVRWSPSPGSAVNDGRALSATLIRKLPEPLRQCLMRARKAAGKVGRPKLDALARAIPAVLEEAIEAGGSSLRDFAAPDGELGYFSKTFDVYGREGKTCRGGCGGQVARIVQGGFLDDLQHIGGRAAEGLSAPLEG